jgi:non-specific serine/threonine protein kinase
LGALAHSRQITPLESPDLGFAPGNTIPGRAQWPLERRLDTSRSSQVWLAEHVKTGEHRVFKFATDGVRLKALKREVTLSRYLSESLGNRPEFVRVFEWNFETLPYYLESEYGGRNLGEWAESREG